jgi:hypothetical protein
MEALIADAAAGKPGAQAKLDLGRRNPTVARMADAISAEAEKAAAVVGKDVGTAEERQKIPQDQYKKADEVSIAQGSNQGLSTGSSAIRRGATAIPNFNASYTVPRHKLGVGQKVPAWNLLGEKMSEAPRCAQTAQIGHILRNHWFAVCAVAGQGPKGRFVHDLEQSATHLLSCDARFFQSPLVGS